MPYYRAVGDIPRKRHTQFRKHDGSLYAEELMGVEGFSSDSAVLYHEHGSTALPAAVAVGESVQSLSRNHPLQRPHFKTHNRAAASPNLRTPLQPLRGGDDIRTSY